MPAQAPLPPLQPAAPPPQPSKPATAEENNGYVVRPPGAEPLENHPRYERIKDINSGEIRSPATATWRAACPSQKIC